MIPNVVIEENDVDNKNLLSNIHYRNLQPGFEPDHSESEPDTYTLSCLLNWERCGYFVYLNSFSLNPIWNTFEFSLSPINSIFCHPYVIIALLLMDMSVIINWYYFKLIRNVQIKCTTASNVKIHNFLMMMTVLMDFQFTWNLNIQL